MKSLKVSAFLCSFTKVSTRLILFFLLVNTCTLFAQQEVKGLIFDSATKQRVAAVYLYNTANEEGAFNNLKGEFIIPAKVGDVLILAKEGYFPDTINIQNHNTLIVNLRRSSIWLKEVHIMARKSPKRDYEKNRLDYESAYKKGDPGPFLSTGGNGVGLSIDALFSLISREGKNARYLQGIIERDYREDIIDYRFTAQLVKSLTDLNDDVVEDFMRQYRPDYYFVLNSNDYELGIYIKKCFESYKINPDARRVQGLFENLEP